MDRPDTMSPREPDAAELDRLRAEILQQAQGAMSVNLAFIGVANGLFGALEAPATAADLAERTGLDTGYLVRWCDAAFAFGLLDADGDTFRTSAKGGLYAADRAGTMMPLAVMPVLGAHIAERAAGLMQTGERPGEVVLGERPAILPLFGPMLEATFGPLFESQILPGVPAFADVDRPGAVALDLGCGNGWYLRRLLRGSTHLRGIGIDGFGANVEQARQAAADDGLADRARFEEGDLFTIAHDEPVQLIAMNRALHHVWDRRRSLFSSFRERLAPDGVVVIWEPAWPDDRAVLREPARRMLAFQNLSEHVQGNHFLRPTDIAAEFAAAGLSSEIFFFAGGKEAVIVGRHAPSALA